MVKGEVIIGQDFEESEDKQKRKKELRRFFIIFTGTIAMISFIISMYFFIQMSVSGYVIGRVILKDFIRSDQNVFGMLILMIVSFVWTVQMMIWFKKYIVDNKDKK